MLRHFGMEDTYTLIHEAALKALSDPKVRTADLGGKGSTTSFTEAICRNMANS